MQANPGRLYFLTLEDTQKVIDACPDHEWRLIVALARYGGLRCPSEHLKLKWEHVDWERDRFTVTSPKTEHHEGKDTRVVPIFAELRPFLLASFEQAAEGVDYVITKGRDAKVNWRTQFTRIIGRAGLTPWPKLFQNLRSTRETELNEDFPIQAVCEWIGNSEPVALKHYLQVTEKHFELAAAGVALKWAQWGG